MLSIFLIGVALSMDAFSIAVSIGTTKLNDLKKLKFCLMIAIMHLIMPLAGNNIGGRIINHIEIDINILMLLILVVIGIIMLLDKNEKSKILKFNLISLFLLAFSVSVDSFSIGLVLEAYTNKIFLSGLIFFLLSGTISYIGLLLGEYAVKILKKKAHLFGAIILFILAIVNLIEHFLLNV